MRGASHNGTRAELQKGWGGGGSVGPKMGLLLLYVFTAIVSLVRFVKTFNGRYLSMESVCLKVLLNIVYLTGEKWT